MIDSQMVEIYTHKDINWGISVLKIVIWGGKSSVLCRKFCFRAMRQRSRKTELASVNRRFTSPNDNVYYVYPHCNGRHGIFIFKCTTLHL